ncbi:aldose epimerase family protein [Halodesulfovibrio marinisediminis]|uniref:Aldose 1-epimerase n=1 Tax=Halodesulfovibrio marinisediminis DSM 17456 TaxID=1121457 RepID=A0A1N6DNG4_9BACT|nr:aldose epimerase family protein [Halodesulfovibrio marinisediminis]SIN72257.1 aldose 1-epimerase [Halodesulfovibrio marinisediminis DSM 17456]
MKVAIDSFGITPSGEIVEKYTLDNERGITVELITFGATILKITTPDCVGNMGDITIGFDSLEDYVTRNHHFGSIVGRYANRIEGASFRLGGVTYSLEQNDGRNNIHGGSRGFDKYVWNAHVIENDDSATVVMQHISPNGDMGFPGTLSVQVAYTLDTMDTLTIDYSAFTDAPTVINLTNHTYFNLSGKIGSKISEHILTVHAEDYLPINEECIPIPEAPQCVEGTVMDFTLPTVIGNRLYKKDPQLISAGGFDHTYVLSKDHDNIVRLAAMLTHPDTGRSISIATSEPGIHIYTANKLNGNTTYRDGITVPRHGAISFETQHFPNSPNRPDFPSTVLMPEHTYTQKTKFTFNKVITTCNVK